MKNVVVGLVVTLSTLASLPKAVAADLDPLSAQTRETIRNDFIHLADLANKHDITGIHNMFWQSSSAMLVAKSANPAVEGNWSAVWGNAAIDQKLSDIAHSGPVVLTPDLSKLKVVGLTKDVAQSYAPVTITVSYAGQDGKPKPFLLIHNWLKVNKEWKIASEIILPVPPTPPVKS